MVNWITEPKVMVLAASKIDDNRLMADRLNDYTDGWLGSFGFGTSDLDIIPEFAGRVCYQSFKSRRPGGNESYIQHILQEGHGSVAEHSVVTLLITGVSRSLTHELIRHRAGTAFSELSQRYYDVTSGRLGFVLPPDAIGNEVVTEAMTAEVESAIKKYDEISTLLTSQMSAKWMDAHPEQKPSRADLTYIRKSARQAARAILPNCTETHIVMTGNLRAWRNIVEQRGSVHADKEIRRLACAIGNVMYSMAPNCFQDLRIDLTDGFPSAGFEYRKV